MKQEDIELAKSTPMMRTWLDIKQSLGDEIVFCRVGDFYELFFDDAERAAKLLDLQLTKRRLADRFYPMAGVPYRSLETYVARLVEKGKKVAIIDQLEDAKQASGTVKRGLTRIVTAGTVTEEGLLNPGQNNYLASFCRIREGRNYDYGIAFCDLSTGDFRAGSFTDEDKSEILRAYSKFSPVELLYPQDEIDLSNKFGIPIDNEEVLTSKPEFWFEPKHAKEIVFNQFNVETTQGYGLHEESAAVGAAGALLRYLQETQFSNFPHISSIRSLDIKDTMMLDAAAIRSLELFENTQDHSSYASLMELMDETVTPMGGRILRHWVANPLANRNKIEERLDAVTLFCEDSLLQHQVRSILSEIGDIERLITRVSMGTARPDELIKLADSMEQVPKLLNKLTGYESKFPKGLLNRIDPCSDLVIYIRKTIQDEPSNDVGDGGVVKYGYNTELDRLRKVMDEGENWLESYIERESNKTNIESLKIKQNNSLGYFIDVPKRELSKVPEYYTRKQVMVNSTRFFTEELKDWETDILEAEIHILELEKMIYDSILKELSQFVDILQITSRSIAEVDCLVSFAFLADRRNYSKPNFNDGKSLYIKGGRHPVIEALNTDNMYVPNDIILDYDEQRILIITGPNFSGKSSLLRATALIVIMAQMGSYVPALEVKLGVVDRIFTRIGASDNLVAGQSTFMLEMIDAANLVNNSTDRSLVIADELGRGTSTYDGLAIAWAITEYLHNKEGSPKTLIATHYHQLSELESVLDAVKNFQFLIRFEDENPVFDHKLAPGSSDKSFGVEVAKLSGLPDEVIDRGRLILGILENKAAEVDPSAAKAQRLASLIMDEDGQSSLANWFEGHTKAISSKQSTHSIAKRPGKTEMILDRLAKIKVEELTPVASLNIISELVELIEDKED